MNIIFFGNTRYSAIDEIILHQTFGLSAVVTTPDHILGRKKILTPTPTKQFAVTNNIPLIEAKQLNNETIEQLNNFYADFFVVADYGLILPQRVLDLPKIGALNVHHSLLPKYRGPSPAPSAILADEKLTGVSIINMTNDVDAGDIYAQKEYQLGPDETTDSLLTALNKLGGNLVVDVIKNFATIKPQPQTKTQATFTPKMTRQTGYIDLENPPAKEMLDRMIRAYYPWPNVWTRQMVNGTSSIIKFLPSTRHPELVSGSHKILVQVEGKKPTSVKDFLNGYPELKNKILPLL